MYADVAASTGWTWEYIGQALTLPRLEAMSRHWASYPPVHKSLAAFIGIKPSTRARSDDPPKLLTNEDIVRHIDVDPRTIQWSARG